MKAQTSERRRWRASSAETLPFQQVVQHLATPCWISDREGQIIWVNDAWVAYTGADVDAIRTQGLKGLHDPAVYGDVVRKWLSVKAAGVADEMVFPLLKRDGTLRPFRTRVTPIRGQDGQISHWFGTNIDIFAQSEAEAQLRSSQEQLQEVFERAGEGIFITDADGRLLDVNAAACAMLQFTREELLAKSVWDLVDHIEHDALTDARRQDDSLRDWTIRRKDASFLVVEVSSRRLSDGRRLGVARDVSARRLADQEERRALTAMVGEQAARASEAERQFRRFWDASRDLFVIVSNIDGVPRLINERAWTETLGYAPERILSTRLLDLVHPEDRERTLAMRHDRLAERPYFGFENRYRRSDGEWVWLSWNVVRDGDLAYCNARDITEQRTVQENLARSERQFRLLVAGVVDYALFMLSPDGIITNWNAGAERIKGYAAHEIIGKHVSVFYSDADRAAGLPAIALGAAKEHGRYEAEGWRVRKDGTLFWANAVLDAIRDEDGYLVGFAKITRDITERRNAQLELDRAHAHLAHAQKVEALGQLTGGVAHDFNNLLMVMGGHAELLRVRIGENARALRSLDAITAACKRGQDLMRHLLAFARRQRLKPAVVSLAERAAGLRALLISSVGASVTVVVDCPADLWPVEIDVNEWELAMLNMAFNARDAMPSGGTLSIAARNLTAPSGELETGPHGDVVELTISDTGLGIPADILPRVFDPFFTTKEVDKGAGLGLSQVYGFVQQSGGRMTVQSELGHGALMTLYLPRATADLTAPMQPPPLSPPSALDILCVEDNPDVADVAIGLLEHLGHHVQIVNSATAALRMLEHGPQPDLVFSDIVMAGEMDGLALARQIRKRWPVLPVLLATGYSKRAEAIGHEFPILGKPYQIAELTGALSAAIAAKH